MTENTVEGNLINIHEELPFNISAEEYENPPSYSAEYEITGIDNDLAGDENDLAGDDNEDAGATRPKTPTGREPMSSIWKYMTLLPSGRIEYAIFARKFSSIIIQQRLT